MNYMRWNDFDLSLFLALSFSVDVCDSELGRFIYTDKSLTETNKKTHVRSILADKTVHMKNDVHYFSTIKYLMNTGLFHPFVQCTYILLRWTKQYVHMYI